MGKLTEIAEEKLKMLGVYIEKPSRFSIIPQLMMAVFNEENKDLLGMHPDDEEDLMQEILDLQRLSDLEVEECLTKGEDVEETEESMEDAIMRLERETTLEGLQDALIQELLWNRKSETEEWPARFYNR